MLTFDLFGLLDILRFTSDPLYNFIEWLYSPYHYTTSLQKRKITKSDSPEEMAIVLIDEAYKHTQLFTKLKIVLGLHLDIKEETLVNSGLYSMIEGADKVKVEMFDSDEIYGKYETIDKLAKQMHTYIMVSHLKNE